MTGAAPGEPVPGRPTPAPPGDGQRPPIPAGVGLVLDDDTRRFAGGGVLAGGHPGRLLTLSPAGVQALDGLVAVPATTPDGAAGLAARHLGRRLVDAGLAHPRAPDPVARTRTDAGIGDVTVVVPVRDRPGSLDRCLTSLGVAGNRAAGIVVVDDASWDPSAVARVAAAHGATLVRRAVNGGPGAARTTGLAVADTELVALVDSDCVVPPGWLDGLRWLFADPVVGAAAPRIVAAPDLARPGSGADDGGGPVPSVRTRYAAARSPLDLGSRRGPVGPGRAVRYVPTAALVVRTASLPRPAFDTALRVGEDVDLIWRLVAAGWSVRYEPSVEVAHAEPRSWPALLGRRFRYGTSAGPLARRHGRRVAALDLRPVPAAAGAALLAGHPVVAGLATAASAGHLVRRTRAAGVPPVVAGRWALGATAGAALGIAHWSTMVAWPVAGVLAARGRSGPSRVLRLAGLAATPALVEWVRCRPDLDPLRWTVAAVADDLAYGLGVWAGALRSRTAVPLLPARGIPSRLGPVE